jgi:hypothetical protein
LHHSDNLLLKRFDIAGHFNHTQGAHNGVTSVLSLHAKGLIHSLRFG